MAISAQMLLKQHVRSVANQPVANVPRKKIELCMLFAQAAVCDQNIP